MGHWYNGPKSKIIIIYLYRIIYGRILWLDISVFDEIFGTFQSLFQLFKVFFLPLATQVYYNSKSNIQFSTTTL